MSQLTIASFDTAGASDATYRVESAQDDAGATIRQALADSRDWPGREITLLAGTFNVLTPIGIGDRQNNLVLRGLGRRLTRLICSETPEHRGCFEFAVHEAWLAPRDVTIKDMTIDGRGHVENPGLDKALISISGVSGSATHLAFHNLGLLADSLGMSGISAWGNSSLADLTVEGCRVESMDYGIRFRSEGSCRDLWIQNNTVDILDPQSPTRDAYNGIAVYGGFERGHISGNNITVHATRGHSGIGVSPGSFMEIVGNHVSGPSMTGEFGIEMDFKKGHGGDEHQTTAGTIIGNTVSSGYAGIGVAMRPSPPGDLLRPRQVMISSNVIRGNEVGIYLENADEIGLGQNLFAGNGVDRLEVGTVTYAPTTPQ